MEDKNVDDIPHLTQFHIFNDLSIMLSIFVWSKLGDEYAMIVFSGKIN